ncbi:MAG: hypothetical protein ACRDL7_07685, partial [Gaiellaceae bacterium]
VDRRDWVNRCGRVNHRDCGEPRTLSGAARIPWRASYRATIQRIGRCGVEFPSRQSNTGRVDEVLSRVDEVLSRVDEVLSRVEGRRRGGGAPAAGSKPRHSLHAAMLPARQHA